MAIYVQPKDFNKRVRFYDGQFLQAQDFIDEQKYHVDRQRRHNQTLHISGVAYGLGIETTSKPNEVKVLPGTAVDRDGRQIVLESEQLIPVAANGWLYIAYHQIPDETQTSERGTRDYTRWKEFPCLFLSAQALGDKYDISTLAWKNVESWVWNDYLNEKDGPPPPVLLAQLALSGSKVTIDLGARLYSGLRLQGPTGAISLRADSSGAMTVWMKEGDAASSLTITASGNVGIGTPGATEKLRVEGGNISTTGNLHTQRGRLSFSSLTGDANHAIYNNYNNLDGEGVWDGMKMNVFAGLDVRVGDANGKKPSSALNIDDKGNIALSGDLKVKGNSSFTGTVGIGASGVTEKLRVEGGNISTTGNLHTQRKRLVFSSLASDANHTIYNNYNNLDGEGAWDGMKMNVFAGLDIRVGESNGKKPSSALSIDPDGNSRISDRTLFFRSGTDAFHGVGWFGEGKLFAKGSVNGPVLYGYAGGALGTAGPEQHVALSWDTKGDIAIAGSLKVVGTVYASNNPVSSKNFRINLRGSAFDSPDGNTTFLKVDDASMGMDTVRGLNTVILNPNGTFKTKVNFDVYGNAALWNDWATWVYNNSMNGDVVAVATYDALRNAPYGGTAEVLLRSIGAYEAFHAQKGSERSPYALLFARGGMAVELSVPYSGPNAQIQSMYYDLLGSGSARRSHLQDRMYPSDPLVYQDIFDAKSAGAIVKYGNPTYDETSYVKAGSWNDRRIIRFGTNNEADGNGALVTIPDGYDTAWVRVLGERWNVIKAYFTDGQGEQVGLWAGGYRAGNCYTPDGCLTDSYKGVHQWLAIPAGRSGKLALISKTNTNSEFWLSGVAFSRNPWFHAAQSAVAFYWASNGGNATAWSDGWHNWNNDVLSKINPKTNLELKVPVVPSGNDKLLYIVEHNDNWNGAMHSSITVDGLPVERFRSTYDNPFARHWNSKIYNRYIAVRIPASLTSGKRFLSVRVDMGKQDEGIYFREIGTHDLEVPLR